VISEREVENKERGRCHDLRGERSAKVEGLAALGNWPCLHQSRPVNPADIGYDGTKFLLGGKRRRSCWTIVGFLSKQ
jgi:hypothetical protein